MNGGPFALSGAKSKGRSDGVTGGTGWLYKTLVSVVAEGHEDPQDIPEQQRHPGKQGQ